MRNPRKNLKGFTLTELLVSLFIFAIIMTAASAIFAQAFSGYRYSKALQRNIENAQFILGILSKELRTSTIVSPSGVTGNSQFVQFYEHSQGRCFRYRFNPGVVEVASSNAADAADCRAMNFSSFAIISTGVGTGRFYVVTSTDTPKRVGKITILISTDLIGATHFHLQTTVSLRDFGTDGSNF